MNDNDFQRSFLLFLEADIPELYFTDIPDPLELDFLDPLEEEPPTLEE